jgi:hypothetical protein
MTIDLKRVKKYRKLRIKRGEKSYVILTECLDIAFISE